MYVILVYDIEQKREKMVVGKEKNELDNVI